MPLTASGQLLVDAGMRLMPNRDRNAWAQWRRSGGWSRSHQSVDPLPAKIAQIAEEALIKLRDELRSSIDRGELSRVDDVTAENDIDRIDATLTFLRRAPQAA